THFPVAGSTRCQRRRRTNRSLSLGVVMSTLLPWRPHEIRLATTSRKVHETLPRFCWNEIRTATLAGKQYKRRVPATKKQGRRVVPCHRGWSQYNFLAGAPGL